MIRPMAGPLAWSKAAVLGAETPGEGIGGGGALGIEAANSGNSLNGFQSDVPSSKTRVCALALPSVIHWRS